MKWEELTPDQQKLIQDYEQDERSFAGTMQKLCNTAITLNVRHAAGVGPVLAQLDQDTAIPTKSGLAGISLVTPTELNSLITDFKLLLSSLNSQQQQEIRAKLAGANINGSV